MKTTRFRILAGLSAAFLAPTALDAQSAVPYGCGVNPKDSLTVLAGTGPTIGTTMQFGIHNPLGTQGCGTFTALLVAPQPLSNYPCGARIPGWGMDRPGAAGEFLVSPAFMMATGPVWGCGNGPVSVRVPIPRLVQLIGTKAYAQGLMYDPASAIGFALTNALELTVGPSPRTLAFGASLASSLNPKGEHEVFEIDARKGDQLVIPYARTTGSGFSLRLELYDDQWNLLEVSEGVSADFRPAPLAAAGKYRLVVRSRSGVTGSYHLSLRRTVAPAGARTIAMGASVSAAISSTWTEIDVYEIAGRVGDVLKLPFARTTGSGFSLRFDLYDAAGNRLASKSSVSSVFTPPPLPASGQYFLWVYNPARNATGKYHLTLQRTVAPGRPVGINLGDSVSASIASTWTEIDVYEFSAAAGEQLYVPYTRTTGSGFSLRLDLYDAQGNLLDGSSGSSANFVSSALPSSGTFFLWVYNPGRDATGNYHLTLQKTSQTTTVGRVIPGASAVNGAISPTWTEIDIYEVRALAGLPMTATYARTTGSGFSVAAHLRDVTGAVVATGVNGTMPINVPTGTYYLWIRNPARNTTGKYWVRVQ